MPVRGLPTDAMPARGRRGKRRVKKSNPQQTPKRPRDDEPDPTPPYGTV